MTAPQVSRRKLLSASVPSGKLVSKVEIQEVSLGPGAAAPLHLHPCPTMGVVTEGRIVFQIEGEAAQTLKPGDAFYEPANARVSKFNNESSAPAKFAVFYLLSEGEQDTIRIL